MYLGRYSSLFWVFQAVIYIFLLIDKPWASWGTLFLVYCVPGIIAMLMFNTMRNTPEYTREIPFGDFIAGALLGPACFIDVLGEYEDFQRDKQRAIDHQEEMERHWKKKEEAIKKFKKDHAHLIKPKE